MRKRLVLLALVFVLLAPGARASEALSVAARGAVLIDAASGRILFAQNANEMLPEASCTKIMTALLALESAPLDARVTAGPNAHGVPGTSIYLSEGETLTMEQMLYALLLRSGNDAAVAIAEHVAGSVSAFAERMNARAAELGADARFVNPHGLDADGHAASALGLAKIMREALKRPDFRKITGTQKKIIPWVGNEYSRVLENKNRLLSDYAGATGGKTGFTSKAGRCLVFSAERDGMELIGAVLNCPNWFGVAGLMLDYGFDHFRLERALEKGEVAAEVQVSGGDRARVAAVAAKPLSAAVPIGARPSLELDLAMADAPVAAGQSLGSARIVCDGRTLASCELVAAEAVARREFFASLRRLLKSWALQFA